MNTKKKKKATKPAATKIDDVFGAGGDCGWSFDPSDEEIEAARWLLNTLKAICDKRRPNADKAALARGLLNRWGEYASAMHRRIHELEMMIEIGEDERPDREMLN